MKIKRAWIIRPDYFNGTFQMIPPASPTTMGYRDSRELGLMHATAQLNFIGVSVDSMASAVRKQGRPIASQPVL